MRTVMTPRKTFADGKDKHTMVRRPKTAPKVQITTRLAATLGIEVDEDNTSAVPLSVLPSVYAKIVHRNRQNVPNDYPENKHWLTCRECGRRGQYDLGLIVVHPELLQKTNALARAGHEEESLGQVTQDIDDWIQFTGYFRCKQCNGRGEWSFGNDFIMFLLAAMLRYRVTDDLDDEMLVQVGRFQSFDGHEPKSATDAEEHLLDLIAQKPDDAFLWNRLGNVYRRGGAPELSVVAFEQSLRYDNAQVESHVSLANILYHIGELDACIQHSHLALAHARFYDKLERDQLHQMTCELLRNLLDASMALDNTDLFLPPRELMEAAASQHEKPVAQSNGVLDLRAYDLYLDDAESFAGLADVYVDSRGPSKRQTRLRHHTTKKRKRKR